jgi:hypothetical protein
MQIFLVKLSHTSISCCCSNKFEIICKCIAMCAHLRKIAYIMVICPFLIKVVEDSGLFTKIMPGGVSWPLCPTGKLLLARRNIWLHCCKIIPRTSFENCEGYSSRLYVIMLSTVNVINPDLVNLDYKCNLYLCYSLLLLKHIQDHPVHLPPCPDLWYVLYVFKYSYLLNNVFLRCFQQNPLVPATFVNPDFSLIRTTFAPSVRINEVLVYCSISL